MKPRKAYEGTIRSILVTLRCLHYLKRNPTSSEKSLWENVQGIFSHSEVSASKKDLLNHLGFIKMMVKRDKKLLRSQLQKIGFINDGDLISYDEDAENDDGDDCFDTVCAICDNGGEVLCCEGKCFRSFHATRDAGVDSHCETLKYTRAQVHDIQNFFCPNCLQKKHQCFACGKLGNSDNKSDPEVFRCISASCGHYYHPHCAASLIHPDSKAKATELEKMIASGESFTCSVHKCIVCNQGENKNVTELQFAMCRRCPKSYHRKCLPRKISLEDIPEEGIKQRAWDGLIPNRILIYCLNHRIDETISTPVRDHILFPIVENKRKYLSHSSKVKVLAKKKTEVSRERFPKVKETVTREPSTLEARGSISSVQVHGYSKDSTFPDTSRTLSEGIRKKKSVPERNIPVRDDKTCSSEINNNSNTSKTEEKEKCGVPFPGQKLNITPALAQSEARKRIMLLVNKESSTSLTTENLLKKKIALTTHACNARYIDKNVTRGKIEGAIEAIQAALHKLENGCSIEDAKAVCGPDILKQILRWKNKFRVYLAPFLHGMRYTSYGRHFTKVDKLKEIVEKLHWYVQNGDMIVDVCCGANDFSLLMREKLRGCGKKCLFKNYDLFQPKNDFNFEKRDWMTVHPRELPTGSQLIMGLNPPFGVRAALANKFIDKVLEFKPKLVILIVPKETERLDRKAVPYDLIWEDERSLSGKSFYLPGSVDVKDKLMEQWNVRAPSLSLWSRPDWTANHRVIAAERGHSKSEHEKSNLEIPAENPRKRRRPNEAMAVAAEEPPLAGDKQAPYDMGISPPSRTDHQHHPSGGATCREEDAAWPLSLYHHRQTNGGSRWAYGEELPASATTAPALPAATRRWVLAHAGHGAAPSVPSGVATASPSSFYHDRPASGGGRWAYGEELPTPAATAPTHREVPGLAGYGAAPSVTSGAATTDLSSFHHDWSASGGDRWSHGEELPTSIATEPACREVPGHAGNGVAPLVPSGAETAGPSSFYHDRPSSSSSRWAYDEELPAPARRETLGYAGHGAAPSVPSWAVTAGPSSFCHDLAASSGASRWAYGDELQTPAETDPARREGQAYAGHGTAPSVPSRAAAGRSSFYYDWPASGSVGGKWGNGDELPTPGAMAGSSRFYHERPTSGEGGGSSWSYGEELARIHDGGSVSGEGPSYERLPAALRREWLGKAGHGAAPSVVGRAATAGLSSLYHDWTASDSAGGKWGYEELGRFHASGSVPGAGPSYEGLLAAARREGLYNAERGRAAIYSSWDGGVPWLPQRGHSGGWLDE
ncbi:unnamed protein product [Spirodela intermedia]|uniref:Zinc finger PHD-type domain-containing protein n=1 Tax=Spirodela intermedia TaxID=51605 RepID=A0A7I8LHN8_SPIIN|nr:unnamed protein product [Spirodela intermedia]